MSKELETKMDEIKSAVISGKEATDADVKSVKDAQDAQTKTIENLQDELAEIKASGVNMPTVNENEVKNESKTALWTAIKSGKSAEGVALDQSLIAEKNLSIGTTTGADETIVEELAASILIPAQEAYSMVADMGVETVSSVEYSRVVQVGRSKAVWGSENTANTAPGANQGPSFVKISAKFAKLTVDSYITGEAAKDPKYDLEAFLLNDIRVEAGREMAQGFIDGDGVGDNPKGLLAHFDTVESAKGDDTRNKDTFGDVAVTGGSLPADDEALIDILKDLELAIATPYLAKSAFYVNRATFKRLSQMKDGNKVHYLQHDLSGKSKGFLFGYPVKIEAFMQDDSAVGNRPVIFGALNEGFKRINWTGMSLLRNPYIVPGNINFHTELRVGTIVGDSNAIKALVIEA